jgi:Bacteriophage related domain of unknown function
MPAAPYDDVFDVIQAYLGFTNDLGVWVAGQWDTSLAPLVYENESDGAPSGALKSWVQVVLDTHLYGQVSIGAGAPGENRWDEDGTLWFHVFTPKGSKSREARRIAKALANMFRGHLLLDDALEFGDADMGAGDPGKENGKYYLLSVSLDWRRTDAQ